MFLRYFDFIFVPFRTLYNRWLQIKNVKGNVQMDVNRAKSMGRRGQQYVGDAQAGVDKLAGKQGQGQGQAGQGGRGVAG